MKPTVNRKWRKKNPAIHKSHAEKRIEDKDRRQIEREISAHENKTKS